MNFTMICGLPNSGKTTYSTNNFTDCVHVDDVKFNIPAERMPNVKKIVIDMLLKNSSCSVDGVFATPSVRTKFINDLPKDCQKVCVYIKTSEEKCIERSKSDRGLKTIHRFAHTFIAPTMDEGWDDIIVIDNDVDVG